MMGLRRRWIAPVLALVVAACATPGSGPSPALDVVVRGGTVVDGTGAPRFRGDVGIAEDRIVRVGDLSGETAEREIDATGLVVAPGFLNIHSHARGDGLATAVNMLTQGVTTEILNPDGGGPPAIGPQLDTLEALGLAVNIGAYIGFNRAWVAVMGADDRRPDPEQIEAMRRLILRGMESGAWGVSAGLDYKPAYFATTDEVVRVVEVARPFETVFTNHERVTPESGYSSSVGIRETLEIGEAAGLRPVVTHMKAQGREQGTVPELLRMMDEATPPAAADAYPYVAGQTSLAALIIPGWAQEGGRDAMLERFRDRELRAQIAAEADEAMEARFGGPAGVYLPESRRELVDVMRETGVESGGEAVIRILEEGSPTAILRFGAEEDVIAILRHPTTSVACDCGATPGPASHPRFYGSYPKVLGRYVREEGHLTLEDAVRKMSGLPAETLGIEDRGLLTPGMAADVVVFDPGTVMDHATFQDPTAPSEGIVWVLVNGVVALEEGAATGARAGRALRRAVEGAAAEGGR